MSDTSEFWVFSNEWPEKSVCYNFNSRFCATLHSLDCINLAHKHWRLHVKPAELLKMLSSQKAKSLNLVKVVEKCVIKVSFWEKKTKKPNSFAEKMSIFRRSLWIDSRICFSLGKTKPKQKASYGNLLLYFSSVSVITLSPRNASCSLKFSHLLKCKTKFIRHVSRSCNYSFPFLIISSKMDREETHWPVLENGLKSWTRPGENSQNAKVFLNSRFCKLT